jgi:ribulose-5-phosphate 4-epimerase/fuculose-1-phosphate aldolase
VKSAEHALREDLAALYRLVHLMGIDHRIYNHHSARIPGDPDHILINPFGLLQDEITAATLIKVDRDGNAADNPDATANQAGANIHWAVYDARDDIRCIAHHHSAAAVAVSALDEGILPMSQGAMQFYNRIGYHDYEGMVFSADEKPRLAASLGPHRAMLLRHHGALICGRSIPETYVLTDDLEKACRSQLLAMQSGGSVSLPDASVCEHTAQQFEQLPQPRGEQSDWPAALRRLERMGIDYKGNGAVPP